MTTGCEASTHSPAQPWPEVRQGSQVHSCQECLSPIISSKFAAKWRAWVILMQPRPSPCRDSVQDSCWESFHGYIWVADLRINPFCCTLGTSADTTLLIVAVGKRRRRVTGAWATALFRVLWCRAMQDHIQVQQFTSTSVATYTCWCLGMTYIDMSYSSHTQVHKCFPWQLRPRPTHAEGAAEGRSHVFLMRFHWY